MERIRQFLNKNIYIFSVRQGLLLTIPFLILGSFSMVIMQFPLKAWQELLPGFAGGSVKLLLMAVYQATFGSLSFIFALMISSPTGKSRLCIRTPTYFSRQCPVLIHCIYLSLRRAVHMGAGVELYGHMHYSHQLFFPDRNLPLGGGLRHLYTMGVAYNFNASMQSMIPAVVTIGLCGLSGLVLSLAFDDVNIMNFGSYLFLKLFGQMGNGLFSILLYILLSHVLWFFGIHGTNTLEAVSRRPV